VNNTEKIADMMKRVEKEEGFQAEMRKLEKEEREYRMKRITDAELAEWERLSNNATPDPLILNRYDHGGGRLYQEIDGRRNLIADFYEEADREFYNTARTALPRLIAEIRRLREGKPCQDDEA